MLSSLEIRNYRNLRHLTIEKLGQVNLLVGKNNTGKTSVLEAVAIYASTRNELTTIKSLLQRRGEFYSSNSPRSVSFVENSLASLSSLYTDYTPEFYASASQNSTSDIYIGEVINNDFSQQALSIDFRKAYRTSHLDDIGREIAEYIEADNEEDIEKREFRFQIRFTRNHLRQTTYSLNNELLFMESGRKIVNDPSQFQYVDSKNTTQYSIESLYSKIALSDKENIVIQALKIIEPRTENFRVIEDGKPIIRLNNGKIRNLSSMGDGVHRVFSIILSMVACDGDYFLIDEFENGLHYSVQEKLWGIIFDIAERLNIQVFATTHSNDTIQSFTSVLAEQSKSDDDGKVIRLQFHNDTIRAVDYSPEELETAKEFNIEVR